MVLHETVAFLTCLPFSPTEQTKFKVINIFAHIVSAAVLLSIDKIECRDPFCLQLDAKYAESVHERVGDLRNCVGFVDGTKIKMAIPIGYYCQRSV